MLWKIFVIIMMTCQLIKANSSSATVKPKLKIHETNMNEKTLNTCTKIINQVMSKNYSTKKTAIALKSELDYNYQHHNSKFNVIIIANITTLKAKSLFGKWLLCTAHNKTILVIESAAAVDGSPVTEPEIDSIEDWTNILFIQNDKNEMPFQNVATSLKTKLDANYGRGNGWAVLVFDNKYSIRAKELYDNKYAIEFPYKNQCHLLIFRGGAELNTNIV